MKPFLLTLMLATDAAALALPRALPPLPLEPAGRVLGLVGDTAGELRQEANRRLIRDHRDRLENDGRGNPAIRGQLLAVAPAEEALAALRAAGFRRLDEGDGGAAAGLGIVVMQVPDGMGIARALRKARRLVPGVAFDVNHIYWRSGGGTSDPDATTRVAGGDGDASPVHAGLLDGGVDAADPRLGAVEVHAAGCGDARVPDAHGTAVASLLAGAGSVLYSFDLYCGREHGGAVTDVARAFDWLARAPVAVVNVSLVGPDNAVLAGLVESMIKRGHVLVAAAGNDGPAAPPLYPAAYPGVIGVVGVDSRNRPLPESARGAHVDFAAPGSGPALIANGSSMPLRGSSFAAPRVARLAALAAGVAPRPGLAGIVLERLTAQAIDTGARGRDDRFGHGLLVTDRDADSTFPTDR